MYEYLVTYSYIKPATPALPAPAWPLADPLELPQAAGRKAADPKMIVATWNKEELW